MRCKYFELFTVRHSEFYYMIRICTAVRNIICDLYENHRGSYFAEMNRTRVVSYLIYWIIAIEHMRGRKSRRLNTISKHARGNNYAQ